MGGNLVWPRGDYLPEAWRKSFFEAMIKGNKLHDDLFDQQGVDLEVEDVVSLADTECGVQSVGPKLTSLVSTQLISWLMC